jgi:hypothetical protein
VLSLDQIAQFRTFGYVVLHGLLTEPETSTLTTEVVTELTAAFGGLGTDTDPEQTGGIRGDYLPLTVDRTPLSQALIADDPRLIQGAAELFGTLMVPTPPIATCFTSNAGWHTDQGPVVGGVKFLAHLQPRTAADGALRVIPGSHDPGFAFRLRSFWAADPAGQGFPGWPVPCVTLETEPGDVIAFDVHLYHSSAGGHDRLAWSVEYLPWPGLGDPDLARTTRELILDAAEFDYEPYDRDQWPSWREWVAGAAAVPSRLLAVQRLRLLGVLGDEDGQVR